MRLRHLTENDEPTIKGWLHDYLTQHLTWWSEAYGVAPQNDLGTLVSSEWEELLGAAPNEEMFVGVVGDKPAGIVYAQTRHDKYLGVELGVLAWIYVAPEARGQGISDQLMDAASRWMKAQKVEGQEVFVTAENEAAVKLYERHGYKVIDHRMLAEG